MSQKLNICIITYPIALAGITPLSNLVHCLLELSDSIYLITGNFGKNVLKTISGIKGYAVDFQPKSFLPIEIIRHVMLQFRIAYHIFRINKKADLYIYFMGDSLVIPSLVCKLFRKPVIWILAGSVAKIYENDNSLTSRLFVAEAKINYKIADKIVIYSKKLIDEWKLEKYTTKILIAHEHHIDLNRYKIMQPFRKRKNIVGYIGRFSEEKGILNFIEAISLIEKMAEDIYFFIGGNGPLLHEIEKCINTLGLREKIKLLGWINQEDLPIHFNEMKLIVLPSYTEGLPNVMLEAMACGTPVVATGVGAIPDIIQDEKTGFILKNNSASCIAEIVQRALCHPDLEQISKNGRILIEKEFTFNAAKAKYQEVLTMSVK